MRYGLTMFPTDRSIDIVTLARAAEERGFVSLYVPEHTHIPISRRTPAPAGEPLAEEYKRSLDPFVVLAAAAAVTERLRVGTGIALVAQRDPIVMAKEIASLDHLSGGRVTVGIGFGWNREEMADHGVDYVRRREVVAEHVAAMQVLWGEEAVGFDGEFVLVRAQLRLAQAGAAPAPAHPARRWRRPEAVRGDRRLRRRLVAHRRGRRARGPAPPARRGRGRRP